MNKPELTAIRERFKPPFNCKSKAIINDSRHYGFIDRVSDLNQKVICEVDDYKAAQELCDLLNWATEGEA